MAQRLEILPLLVVALHLSVLCQARTWSPRVQDFNIRPKRQLGDRDIDSVFRRGPVGSFVDTVPGQGFGPNVDSEGPIPFHRPNLEQPTARPKIFLNGNKIPIRSNADAQVRQNGNKIPIRSNADAQVRQNGNKIPIRSNADAQVRQNGNKIPIRSNADAQVRQNGKKIPIRANTDVIFVSQTVTQTVIRDLPATAYQTVPQKTVLFTHCTILHVKGDPQTIYQTVTTPATVVTQLVQPTVTVTKVVTLDAFQGAATARQPQDPVSATVVHGQGSQGYSYQEPKVPFVY